MKILVVDDDAGCRKYIGKLIASKGYIVKTASAGQEGIALGLCFHPHLLITDWMLKEQLHGLHISKALSSINRELNTILVTGYSSADLESDANRAGIFRLLPKPFEAHELLQHLTEAAYRRSRRSEIFGLIHRDADGKIQWLNHKAARIIGPISRHLRITELLASHNTSILESRLRWALLKSPRLDISCWIRTHSINNQNFHFILKEEEDPRNYEVLTSILLGEPEVRYGKWPFPQHVLLIETNRLTRRINVRQLENSACPCYAASSEQEALKLFEANPQIGIVLIDLELPEHVLQRLCTSFRLQRKPIRLIGHTNHSPFITPRDIQHLAYRYRSDFGIEQIIFKPYRVYDLIEILSSSQHP